MAKPQQRCVFCDRTGLSKEHVWSEWTYQLVPTMKPGSHVSGVMSGVPGKPRSLESFKTREGSVNTIKVKVVCERHCNNGWMSALETSAKPILSPLIRGDECQLSQDDQLILARWIALKVIVSENSRRDLAASSSQDRRQVMNGLVSPDRWQIWIGKHDSKIWYAGGYHRHAVTLGIINPTTGIPEPFNNSLDKNTQAVTLGLGRLIIHAIYTQVENLGKMKFTGQLGEGLRQITPYKGHIVWPSGGSLTDIQVQYLTTAFDRFASKLKWTEIPQSSP